MKPTITAGAIVLIALSGAGTGYGPQNASPQPTQTAPSPVPGRVGYGQAQASVQEVNHAYVQEITRRIAGHEQEPAEQVFKNVQWLKGIPATQLLLIMNRGYSRALGVTCLHCHDDRDFSSDEKRPKRAAREMAVMHRSINQQLAKMQNLKPAPEGRFVNCSTCHRGAVDPLSTDK